MIPRIAHFHWTGPRMTWLRMMSIATFKRHNPGWEIRLHDTPREIREFGLMACQEADWTWWKVLYEHGGLQVATDIVFTNPVPDEWLKHELVGCPGEDVPNRLFHNAGVAAVAGHPYVKRCLERCLELATERPRDFQAFGPSLMRELDFDLSSTDFLPMTMDDLCPVRYDSAHLLWADAGAVEIPEACIGVHWYGGDQTSRWMELAAGPDSNSIITDLALDSLV